MPFDIDDDQYVAKLLTQDAKKASKTYDMVGLDAFNPKRSGPGAPKPNTNFLRHIIRQTDSHNAALLAKEAEDSSLRLRQMNRERDRGRTEAVDRAKRRIEGRLSPPHHDEDPRQRRSRRRGVDEDEDGHKGDRKRRHGEHKSGSHSRNHREDSRARHGHKRRHGDSDEDRASHRSRRTREHRESGRRDLHDREEKLSDKTRHRSRRERRSYSRLLSRSRSRSPRREGNRERHRPRSPRCSSRSPIKSRKRTRRSNTPASDSDPLEALVGPLPPPSEPTVRSRGRGALKANALGIESRFSASYDPTMDMRPGSHAGDDWDEALDAMRDRERWKQQGADRLRAAGFKDEQVKKWEKGGDPMEEDVVWTKRGQDREWDRGKVVDEDGDVKLRAEWGRLK